MPEICQIEGVNPVGLGPGSTAYEQRVVNLRSAPSSFSNQSHRLHVIFLCDWHHYEVRQKVIHNDARRLGGVNARPHRQARERRVHLGDRVQAHEPLILGGRHAPQRGPRLSEMGMALFRGCHQNAAIKENLHRLRLQNGSDPLLAPFVNQMLPVRPRLCRATVDPQALDPRHRRSLLYRPQQEAARLLQRLQFSRSR